MKKRPRLAVLVVFFVSGVMHEFVLNLPLYLITGRILFGTMMIYFMLNGLGVLLEKRFLRRSRVGRVFFCWMFVLGPVPLLANEGMLRVLHLW